MVDAEYIRSLIRADRFQRFTLVLDDGSRIEIRRPASIAVDPRGKSLFAADTGPHEIPVSNVREVIVEPLPTQETVQRIETIRQWRNESPFKPFTVVVDDGRKFRVDRSFRIGISPSGREICYAAAADDFHRVPSHRVKEVTRDG